MRQRQASKPLSYGDVTTRTPPRPTPVSGHRALPSRHQRRGTRGTLSAFTMIRLTGSATGSTATALPPGTRSIPPATTPELISQTWSAPPLIGRHRRCGRPLSARFRAAVVSSGFYHRIAFALPFGLASTHAGAWQCSPAVTLSGRLTPHPRDSPPWLPPASPGRCISPRPAPAGTDEMFVVLNLLTSAGIPRQALGSGVVGVVLRRGLVVRARG